MLEVVLSATVTALAAAAGATLISAVSNASTQTRDIRTTKTQGHYALAQIVRAVREARGIGQVTAGSITLWLDDTNQDDVMNLYEAGAIRYDAATRQVTYEYIQPATAGAVSSAVLTTDFQDVNLLRTRMTVPERQIVTWAADVSACTFSGYPNNTETRVVDVRLDFGDAPNQVTFRGSASPRAAADYLFKAEAQSPPPSGSTRKARKHYSRWTGYGDLSTGGTVLTSE
jgi:hypothetical protein